MTTKEAFALACETIERKLDGTIRRWGYTVKREEEAGRVCWQIAELDSAELISVTELNSFIRLEVLAGKMSTLLLPRFSAKNIEAAVERYVSRALKVAVLRLANNELLDILGLDEREGVLMLTKNSVVSELLVWIDEKEFYTTFRLSKKCWSWKVTTFLREPVTTIRRPLGENPIPVLCEAVKCLGLLLL